MKKYVAVFEVPDGFKPRFNSGNNADGWFENEKGETIQVSVNPREVIEDGKSEGMV